MVTDYGERFGVIYEVVCSTTGKKYIGQTLQNPTRRFTRHLSNANKKLYNSHFYNAIRKYGSNSFSLNILLKNVPSKYLNHLEKVYIEHYDTYNNGYNSTLGGEGTSCNKLSEEHILKLKEVHKGNSYGKGWKPTDEQLERLRNAHKGKKLSDETKKKLSEGRIGVKHHNTKLANIYNKDGIMIAEGVCLRDWCRENPEFDQGALSKTARGKAKHHKGLHAVYTISYKEHQPES